MNQRGLPLTGLARPILPPLRRRIRRGFFILVTLYAALGFFMVSAVFLAGGITPQLIHLNYDSIAAAREMDQAWDALQSPERHSTRKPEQWRAQFEAALGFGEKNITEPGEGEAIREVRKIWSEYEKDARAISLVRMPALLESLVRLNEQGMFRLAQKSADLSRRVFWLSVLIFALTLALAVLISDGLASRLARPIKAIAESLRTSPGLDRKLKLADSDSLELRILTDEIERLWGRLAEFRQIDVEHLAAERERLETVLASVEDVILVLDADDKVVKASEGLLRLLNLTAAEIVGQRWSDLPTAADNYLKLRSRFKQGFSEDNAIELRMGDSTRVFAARVRELHASVASVASVGPLGSKDGGKVYLLHDITELRHRERLRHEFIGVLSHELKTPLQSLGTASELLQRRAGQQDWDADTRMLVETVHEDVARIRAVANDFMQVSSVNLHSLRLRLERVPISELIQEWIKPFRVVARDRGVRLVLVLEGSPVIWVRADIVKFPWAISNLIANAIRVSGAGEEVTVFLSDRGSSAQIEVRDEGPGIAPEVQARMFEPYYQAPPAAAGASAGFLGLGLTIAKEVVEAHDGRLEYFARRPHGSVFRISLPDQMTHSGKET